MMSRGAAKVIVLSLTTLFLVAVGLFIKNGVGEFHSDTRYSNYSPPHYQVRPAVSEECQKREYLAIEAKKPIQVQLEQVKKEVSDLAYKASGSYPSERYPQTLPPYKERNDQLSQQFLGLLRQIEQIDMKYKCD